MISRPTRTIIIGVLAVLALLVVFQVSRTASAVSPDESFGWSTVTDWSNWGWPTSGSNHDAPTQTEEPKQTQNPTPEELNSEPKVETSTSAPTPAPKPTKVPIRINKNVDPFNGTFDVPDVPFSDPAGPQPHQIALLTAGDGKGRSQRVKETTKLAIQDRKAYSQYHGYVFNHVDMSKYNLGDVHAVWGKIPAIIETFQKYPDVEWVWWLDLDAIIMTPAQDLVSLVLSEEGLKKQYKADEHWVISPPVWTKTPYKTPKELDFKNVDLIVAQDQNGLNAGSFFLRRSAFTQLLLDVWRDSVFIEKDYQAREQDALLHFILEHPTVRNHAAMVRQNSINAYVNGGGEMMWEEGGLVVHLAGCWVKNLCEERWNEFWAKRAKLPKH